MTTLRQVSLAVGLLTAVACASGPPDREEAPRDVRVSINAGQVQLNRDAYVAVFELEGRRGVSLLYPVTEETASKPTPAGRIVLEREWRRRPSFVDAQRGLYQPGATGLLNRRAVRSAGEQQGGVLVIASDEPLAVWGMLQDPRTLRRLLGSDYVRPHRARERLIRVVVSDLSGNWDWDQN